MSLDSAWTAPQRKCRYCQATILAGSCAASSSHEAVCRASSCQLRLQHEKLFPTRQAPDAHQPSIALASGIQSHRAEQLRLQAERQGHLGKLLQARGIDAQLTATAPADLVGPRDDHPDVARPRVSYFAVPANVHDQPGIIVAVNGDQLVRHTEFTPLGNHGATPESSASPPGDAHP